MDVINGKWKGVILYHLLTKKKLRFNEIQKILYSVTPRMLSKQLRELEDQNVVKREIHAEVPVKVEYSLTSLGLSLSSVIEAMEKWGKDWQEKQIG